MKKLSYVLCLLTIVATTWGATRVTSYLEAGSLSKAELESMSRQLEQIPTTFGDWERVAEAALPDKIQRTLQCHGAIHHSYQNSRTGAKIQVAVLFGPRGPIAVHTPDICYAGAGTRAISERKAAEIRSESHSDTFWTLQLAREIDLNPIHEVWYAWSDGGPWKASEQPRFWPTSNLYKIQVAGTPSGDPADSDCKSFLAEFLPVLRTKIDKS